MSQDPHVATVAGLFESLAPDYDNVGVPFFAPIAAGLVDALAVASGESCADLGCGSGAVTRLLIDAVAPDGRVTGLDISPAMLERARAALGARDGLELLVGDAGDPPLPEASYDVVASSLVLFFLPQPWEALRRWVRLVRPGGRIGLTTFGPEGPGLAALDALLTPWMPPADPKSAGIGARFGSDEGMERALEEAGADSVRTVTGRVGLPFAGTSEWERFSRSVGQRVAWGRMSEAETDGVREAADRIFSDHPPEAFWQDVRSTLGRRPEWALDAHASGVAGDSDA